MRVKLEQVCSRGSSNLMQKEIAELTGAYPIFGAAGQIGTADFYHQGQPYVAVVKDGAGIGRTMLLPAFSSVIGTLQYLIPNEKVLPDYLCYVVQHMKLAKYFSGATIPHIYFRDYKNEEFNLESLDRQREIVSILNRIQRIIAHRRTQLAKLDELVKCRFVEMFGDPANNSKNWVTKPLRDCLSSIDGGKSFVCQPSARTRDWPAILKLSAITSGFYQPNENKAVIDNEHFSTSAEVKAGDLLFTRKNTPELVGISAYVYHSPVKLMIPDLIFRLNTNENCNKIFLWKLINHELFRSSISAIATGSAKSMSNISQERLLKLHIICPPVEQQNAFASFVQRIDKLRFVKSDYRLICEGFR